MNSKNKEMFFKKIFDLIIMLVVAVCITVLWAVNLFEKLEYRAYDGLLSLKKAPQVTEQVTFIQVDDDSINKIGRWPWNRTYLGDVLIRLRELGASQSVFDIEYTEDAPRAVNDNLEELAQDSIRENGEYIANSVLDFSKKISTGKISSGKALAEGEKLVEEEVYPALYEINRVLGNNIYNDTDDYFSRCVQFFGNTYLTVNVLDIGISRFSSEDNDELEYSRNRFLLSNVKDEKGLISKNNDASRKESAAGNEKGFVPPIKKIVKSAKRIGFTNVVVDKDGTRRRIELLNETNGLYTPQLAFGPLTDLLNVESFERKNNYLILHNAKFPERSKPVDIKIPLDDKGRMLINWAHGSYGDSFIHIPAWNLIILDDVEALIYSYMKQIEADPFTDFSKEDAEDLHIISEYRAEYERLLNQKTKMLQKCRGFNEENEAVRGGVSDETFEEYIADREYFFEALKEYADSLSNFTDWEKNELLADFVKALNTYIEDLATIRQMVEGKTCFFGVTASSSTDLGVTPFEHRYPNLGTHANVMNTILQMDFITPVPSWIGLILAFVICLVVLLISINLSPAKKNITGIIYLFTPTIVIFICMMMFNVYIPIVIPSLFAFVVYVSLLVKNFVVLEGQKKKLEHQKEEIQKAFGKALAKEVVDEIVKHPEMMEPGGFDYNMSAIFTDIQKFSGFSEFLTAGELVQLLNYYLNKMADFIIHESGIVDKYEGDAIVAFVGAPFEITDHAERACRAAINMKTYESQMNEEIYKIAALSEEEAKNKIHEIFGNANPANMSQEKAEVFTKKVDDLYSSFKKMVEHDRTIFTRIGINSGAMVAGFMGSENKLNYTMMGNNVNLASRLEGVNKQYRTNGILIHQQTREMLGENFIVRRLDRVRVVNVNTPIRLYELIGLKDSAEESLVDYVNAWEQIMDLFEAENYQKALEGFKKLLEYRPQDNVAKYYIELTEKFFLQGKYPVEADNFGVEYNPEDKVFKLLQK